MPSKVIEPVHLAGGRLGSARRWHPEQVPNAERHLKVALLAELIGETVTATPPLTVEQLTELSRLLHSGQNHGTVNGLTTEAAL